MSNSEHRYDYDMFVSYCNLDQSIVSDLVELLEHFGARVFCDQDGNWDGALSAALEEAVERSERLCLVLSQLTGTRAWVEAECRHFLHTHKDAQLDKAVKIFKLAEGPQPPSFQRKGLGNDAIDARSSFIDGFLKLLLILNKNLALERSGLIKYYRFQRDVPTQIWDILYRRAKRRIRLMGHSKSGGFRDEKDMELVLLTVRELKEDMKVILLNPAIPTRQQLQAAQSRMSHNEDLPSKIWATIDSIRRIKRKLADDARGLEGRICVHVTDEIMYSSLSVFDSLAFVCSYSSRRQMGDHAPTYLVREGTPLFKFYETEFDDYWKSSFHPEEVRRRTEFNSSTRIRDHAEVIACIDSWLGPEDRTLPPPTTLIIYPTYKCEWEERPLCPNCDYQTMRRQGVTSMPLDRLRSVLDQATNDNFKVQTIELSGGGEPLMYEHMDELLDDILSRIQSEPDLEFGLLTNGLYLSDSIAEKAARAFSYVRLSYAEAFGNPEGEELEDRFIGNLAGFLNGLRTQAIRPNVGLKFLLSHQNTDQLVAKLGDIRKRLEKKECFGRLNHIRIKAMRSRRGNDVEPTEEDALKFRNEFYEKLFDPDGWPEDIQVDLDLRRVNAETFRCRLSPLIAVVDPNGCLMACCNYVNAYEQLKIGDLNCHTLKQLWGSKRHRDVVCNVDAETVCNSSEGAPCRLVEYCEVLAGDHFSPTIWRPRAPRRGL